MSLSIYLVSSNNIDSEEALKFLADLHAVDVSSEHVAGQVVDGESNVWVSFLGSSVLDESDEDERSCWAEHLEGDASSFFELTVGKGAGSMDLAVQIAKQAIGRWNVVVDDLHDTVYDKDNLCQILEC